MTSSADIYFSQQRFGVNAKHGGDLPMVVTPIRPEGTARIDTPQYKMSEAVSLQFEHSSYLLVSRTHICLKCQAIQNYSDLLEVWTHPTKTAQSNAKILKSTATIKEGYHVASVVTPAINVPICNECIAQHEQSTQRPTVSYDAWAKTLQRKAQEGQEARRVAAQAKQAPTLDDL